MGTSRVTQMFATRRERPPHQASGEARDSGFVLITVIGALLILTILVSTLMSTSRNELRARTALNSRVEQQALADGITRLVAYRVAEQRSAGDKNLKLPLDGTPQLCRDGNNVVETKVTDVNGLIDINFSSLEALEILLRGLGVVAPQSQHLAAAIFDFRSPDDAPSPGGAKAEQYALAGRSYGPKNAPFDTVEELDQVLGMTPALLDALRPLVTVHSRAAGIDTAVAPVALLRVLARGQNGGDDAFTTREQFQTPTQLPARVVRRGSVASRSRVPAFLIEVTVSGNADRQVKRAAVVELSTRQQKGFSFRDWGNWTPHPLNTNKQLARLPACETSN